MITLDETSKQFTFASVTSTAVLRFRRRADRFIITHTMIPPDIKGQGVGGELIAEAVEYAAQRDLTVVPLCPFAVSWLRSHPEIAALALVEWPDADDARQQAGS